MADETGLEVTVCHFPPGTSKWNKIEHRLFSHITKNWRGRPLVSHEVVVESDRGDDHGDGAAGPRRTWTGSYPTKVKVTERELRAGPTDPHDFHGEWNYTILARTHRVRTVDRQGYRT